MLISSENKLLLLLTGPTGIGKTYLSTFIAQELPLEIVSADSRQVYKYLDIGTAKPSQEIRKKIPHHFIDILEPDQYFSAGEFGQQARKKIKEIFLKNKTPIIVGGSGLYIKALLEGFFEDNIRDDNLRTTLEKRIQQEGVYKLYQELKQVDPPITEKIHPNDSQRIVRALEVFLVSGQRFSDLHKQKSTPPFFQVLKFGLTKERSRLYSDINSRVDQMFHNGFLDEVSGILKMGYQRDLNSLNTVGYKEVFDYLEGVISMEECKSQIKTNSRRYAKRQYTWLNSDKDIFWINLSEQQNYLYAKDKIVKMYQNKYAEIF
jgi:tRNA dimethylallyltransferase